MSTRPPVVSPAFPLPDQGTLSNILAAFSLMHDENTRGSAEKIILHKLKTHPGMVRSDREWYAKYPLQSPLIFEAIGSGSLTLVDAFLDGGADPMAHAAEQNIMSQKSALAEALAHSNTGINHEIVHLLLERMKSRQAIERDGTPTILHAGYIMAEKLDINDPLQKKRQDIFTELLNKTTDAALSPGGSVKNIVSSLITDAPPQTSEDTLIFMIRAMADRGMNLDECSHPLSHPLQKAFMGNGRANLGAAMLAAGLPENNTIIVADNYLTLKQAIASSTIPAIRNMRARARGVLEDQLQKVRLGKITPEKLLFTPENRLTWQAQGLARFNMLDPIFSAQGAHHFRDADEQIAFAMRVQAAMPADLQTSVNLPALMRDYELAQPENSAMVEFMHGGKTSSLPHLKPGGAR